MACYFDKKLNHTVHQFEWPSRICKCKGMVVRKAELKPKYKFMLRRYKTTLEDES